MPKEKTKGKIILPDSVLQPSDINHLLVIAIDNYKYAPKLNNCVRDAEAVVKLLTKKYRFDPENVIEMYGNEGWQKKKTEEQPTRSNILDTLATLRGKIKEGENLVILFSGHGEIDDEVGYWVPIEAKVGKRRDYISEFDVKVELNKIKAFHIFLIMDACFAGSIFTTYRNIKPGGFDKKSRWGLASSHSREVALDSGTEKDTQNAWDYYFYSYYGKLYRYDNVKAYGFSCRCLQDN